MALDIIIALTMTSHPALPSRPPLRYLALRPHNHFKPIQPPQAKEKCQEKPSILINPSSLPQQIKQLYNLQKQSFLAFSRAHYELHLRRDSLFLAFEIYSHSLKLPLLRGISNEHLQCVSLFLAAKYQQIYPPTLSDLFRLLGTYFDLQTYRKNQKKIIESLDFNLNLPLLSRELDSSIGDTNDNQRNTALYLLQIAIITSNIFCYYPRPQIIHAISLLAKRKDLNYLAPELSDICKLLLSAKSRLPKTEPYLHLKYQHIRYCCVSITPL